MEGFRGKLSVLMPCHNEAPLLRRNIRETARALDPLGDYEILVIDDGSHDTSWEEALAAARKATRVRVLRYVNNRGKGFALKYGFRHARGDVVCFLDGDLDIHPKHIPRFLKTMAQYDADVVVGSKRHPQSRVVYPAKRRFLSRGYNALIRATFNLPLHDTQVGLKLFRREVLEDAFPRALVKQYAFDLELLLCAHRMGYRIVEAPVDFTFVNQVGSGVNPKAIAEILRDTLSILYRFRALHYYDHPHEEDEAPLAEPLLVAAPARVRRP